MGRLGRRPVQLSFIALQSTQEDHKARGDITEHEKAIIQFTARDYGHVKVKLAPVLEAHGITRNRLRTLTGVKYDVIGRYYKGCNIAMADLDFLAKVCFVLNCKIEDLLEYVPPKENE